MQNTIHDTGQDTDFLNTIEAFLRKLFVMWEAQRWSRFARKALRDMDSRAAEYALRKYDELKDMI